MSPNYARGASAGSSAFSRARLGYHSTEKPAGLGIEHPSHAIVTSWRPRSPVTNGFGTTPRNTRAIGIARQSGVIEATRRCNGETSAETPVGVTLASGVRPTVRNPRDATRLGRISIVDDTPAIRRASA